MKKTVTLREVSKIIKDLENELSLLEREEKDNNVVKYCQGEDIEKSDYDFESYRNRFSDLHMKLIHLRGVRDSLNIENIIYVTTGFAGDSINLTVSQAVVYLAYLNKEKARLESMASKKPLDRNVTYNGSIEYAKTLYERNDCLARLDIIKDIINQIQLGIDKTNLNTTVEVDI